LLFVALLFHLLTITVMETSLSLLCWVSLCAFCAAGGPHTRIRVGLDSYPSRNPTPDQPTSHALLDFRIVKAPTDIPKAVDVLAHAEWKTFKSLFSTKRAEFLPYFDNSDEQMTIMNEKGPWKTWMQLIGLGEHIPASLTHLDADTLEYPVIVKKSMSHSKIAHGGYGISVVHDPDQLKKLIESILTEGHTYFVEESLTGMGLSEMSSFGAAFRGKVVSLRCYKRTYKRETLTHAKFNANFSMHDGAAPSPPFVKGFSLVVDDDHLIPCGRDVVSVVQDMFSHTAYTGPFCNDWKLDRHLVPKMMETNARMCGTLHLAQGDGLLLSTFVPLAYAALDAIPSAKYRDRSALLHSSKYVSHYQRIAEHERAALTTGGGWVENGTFITVARFDMNLRLPPLLQAYNLTLG
jgi:hypothetical protein